ncbi:MAG: sulfite exporter TauE/SafE family protein, partial [Cyanobacteria bacterium]|nr:sulfite exporter TauE/SafE family protein [Cyanobacteriota bacterium]
MVGGLLSGILAGLLGIGGGALLGPLLIILNYPEVKSFATSGFAIVITSASGTIENWRRGYINLRQVLSLGFPALITAQVGVFMANWAKAFPHMLLVAFGVLSLANIYLIDLKNQLARQQQRAESQAFDAYHNHKYNHRDRSQRFWLHPFWARISTGSIAGLLAGLFGIGGGVVMVPMQILLLGEAIKPAIQTSLGVVVITAISATLGHALSGNILWIEGVVLGLGGLVGAQISTRLLPKLPDRVVSALFRSYLAILAVYI